MTYSLVARDPVTNELGVAVQSHWFGVGAVVPHVRPGVAAIATQSVPDPHHGHELLDRIAAGTPPDRALDEILEHDEGAAYRQIGIVDAQGRTATHTGDGCMDDAGHTTGDGWSAQANMMASAEVWPAMAEAFVSAEGPLAERMLAALDAAEAAGGDVRGRQSAALVVLGTPHPVDLRVEDHPEPLEELRRLLTLHRAYAAAEAADEAMAEGRLDDAGRLYEEAARRAPGNPELEFWSGLSAVQRGDTDAGLERVRGALRANPRLSDLLQRLGEDVAPAAAQVRAALTRESVRTRP